MAIIVLGGRRERSGGYGSLSDSQRFALTMRFASPGIARRNAGRFRFSAIALLVIACCEGRPPSSDAVDPFNVRMAPELSLREIFRLGGEGSPPEGVLGPVGGAVFLTNGLLAITSRSPRTVKLFSETGQLTRTVGGRGAGPGEFQTITAISALANGGFVVWDQVLGRLTYYADGGAMEDIIRVQHDDLFAHTRPIFVGALTSGSAVFKIEPTLMWRQRETEGLRRDTVVFLAFFPGEARWRQILTQVGPEYLFWNKGGGWGEETLLFGRRLVAVVTGNVLAIGSTDSLVIQRYGVNGDWLDALAIFRPIRTVTEPMIEAERRARLEKYTNPFADPGWRLTGRQLPDFASLHEQRIENLESYRTLPAFADLMSTGADDSLWVRDYLPPNDSLQRWYLIDPNSEIVGWLQLARSDSVLATTTNRFVVLSRDNLEVETITISQVRLVEARSPSSR